MEKKKEAPEPYDENGRGFVGEGRGAPPVPVRDEREEETTKEPSD